MAISHCYWHLVVKNGNFTLLLTSSGQEWHFSHEKDGKIFIFTVSNWSSWKNKPCSEGFNTHLWGFKGDRWENIHFLRNPSHVTPQIDRLGKTSTVLRVSTHIYGVSQEIDGKMFIFRVNLGMWFLKSIVSEKQTLFWWFQHTFMVFPRT